MSEFLSQFRKYIRSQKIFLGGEKVLVAVSGGADSVALLVALDALRCELGLELVVAHYNHALRSSSMKDEAFVRRLARDKGFLYITQTNRAKIPHKGSLEDYAREIRYKFLVRTAKRCHADCVALAHTQDDLAETVLMRLIRGTGLSGLRGMASKRLVAGVPFIRPFLTTTRLEIEKLLKEYGMKHIEDPTNQSVEFTRNKVRKYLIPYLINNFCLDIKDRLITLAEIVAVDYAFIETEARKAFFKFANIKPDVVSFSVKPLKDLHPALFRMLLRLAVDSLKNDQQSFDFKHIQAMESLILSDQDSILSLPDNIVLEKKTNKLFLKRL